MEQLRQLIEALIVEGVLEKEVTDVSREIIDELKLRLSKTAGFVRSFKFRVDAPDAIDAKSIEVYVRRGQAQDKPIVSGEFKSDPENLSKNAVKIFIDVPRAWEDFSHMLSQLSIVVPELKDFLRHEFEHSKQSADDFNRISAYDFDDLEQLIKYFLDPAEVQAHVSGMYKQAKTRKIDLMDVFIDRQGDVMRLSKKAGADEAGAQEIAQAALDSWIAFAQKRFPSARL